MESIPRYPNGMPKKLYKYREWGEGEFQKILTNAELTFSKPLKVGYGNELMYRVQTLNGSELFNFLKHRIINTIPFQSEDFYNKLAKEKFETSNWRNSDELEKSALELIQGDMNNLFGVLSLSGRSTNHRMWNEFSSSGTGFCVGLDTKLLRANILLAEGDINYFKPSDLPVFRYPSLNSSDYSEDMFKIILSIPENLKHEEEYRFIKPFPGSTEVPKEVITEVILGYNMQDNVKNELVKIVDDNLPNALILESIFDSTNSNITVRALRL